MNRTAAVALEAVRLPAGEAVPADSARARTYQGLLAEAVAQVNQGRMPSVAEVAAIAGVSRATAYRYFPNRSALISAVVDHSLGPVRRVPPEGSDATANLHELFTRTFPRFVEYEPQLRAALSLALEHESLERAGRLEEAPFRRGYRRDILNRAARPLERTLGRARYDRLIKALSIVYGIEPWVILKDIWGAGNREVEEIALWMLEAMLEKAQRETQDAPARAARTPARRRARNRRPAPAG